MNWKPYWGANNKAEIVHFHGPKLGTIASIIENTWDWSSKYGQQLGSLFASSAAAYEHFIGLTLDHAPGLSQCDVDYICAIKEKIPSFNVAAVSESVDLAFTDFQMFPANEVNLFDAL
jgi:hypothetical protein